ncbi:uncharacterized protein LOC108104861 [Drosophila eugracilis]|uniref:uncharacterized protein LOC108104861 n=1 Tax=Drosophila eugracilis TaxID=29029 RepID=UPI0007E64B38|nr:uncharacterized protein LOC108104861 [Drosophila eugracilis]
MHKNTIWYGAVLLVVYFTLVFCEEAKNEEPAAELDNQAGDTWENLGRELMEFEGRTRRHRHHMFWYRHLWPLAIAYWIKVKVVIVSFFVGSAIYLGLRYFWPHARCNQEIILDHPPSSFSHHDHIPYSLDHDHSDHYDGPTSFDSSASFEPYSGYSSYAGSDIVSDVHSDYHSESPSGPTGPVDTRRRGRRSTEDQAHLIQEEEQQEDEQVEIVDEEISESVARQMPAEEQIADFMFAFLGLDSKACRRRFVCEMEFRSKLNPMTSMAFRIVGRGFFEKYTNARNPNARATNFGECAAVNPECIFVENENPEAEANQEEQQPEEEEQQQEDHQQEEQAATEETAVEDSQNEINLKAERRHARHKNRKLSTIAEHILMQ